MQFHPAAGGELSRRHQCQGNLDTGRRGCPYQDTGGFGVGVEPQRNSRNPEGIFELRERDCVTGEILLLDGVVTHHIDFNPIQHGRIKAEQEVLINAGSTAQCDIEPVC
jgi:hypothetical protein